MKKVKPPKLTHETASMLLLILIGIHLFVWGFTFEVQPPQDIIGILLFPFLYIFKYGLEAFGLYLAIHSFVALIFLEARYFMNNLMTGGDIFGLADLVESEGEGESSVPNKGIYT